MPEITISIDQFIAENKATTVPKPYPRVNQRDQDCGIFALHAALSYRSVSHGKEPVPAPRKDISMVTDHLPLDEFMGVPVKSGESLRHMAKANQLSQLGEMFSAPDMKQLAAFAGFRDTTNVKDVGGAGLFKTVKESIDKGKTVLVPYYQTDGEPELDSSKRPGSKTGYHWCLVFGYFRKDERDYLIATHWGKYWSYAADNLARANSEMPDEYEQRFDKLKFKDASPAAADPNRPRGAAWTQRADATLFEYEKKAERLRDESGREKRRKVKVENMNNFRNHIVEV